MVTSVAQRGQSPGVGTRSDPRTVCTSMSIDHLFRPGKRFFLPPRQERVRKSPNHRSRHHPPRRSIRCSGQSLHQPSLRLPNGAPPDGRVRDAPTRLHQPVRRTPDGPGWHGEIETAMDDHPPIQRPSVNAGSISASSLRRREFLRSVARNGSLGILAAIAAFLTFRPHPATPAPDCARPLPCGRCPLLADCGLPRAKRFRIEPPISPS